MKQRVPVYEQSLPLYIRAPGFDKKPLSCPGLYRSSQNNSSLRVLNKQVYWVVHR
ncbi:MAG: hypothetical protein ACMXYD_01370 [Candidatus Woesearchaeota archaeon]